MFYDVFEKLCINRGLKPNTATKALGLSSATATNWKTSGRIPSGETLAKIADFFDCSVDYLLGREGAKKEPTPVFEGGLRESELRVMKWFRALPPEKRQAIIALVSDTGDGLQSAARSGDGGSDGPDTDVEI